MKFKLPKWLSREEVTLPPWASIKQNNSDRVSIKVEVNTREAILEWLDTFGVLFTDATQYWIECAYQCAKLDVQAALVGTKFDPRTSGKPAEIHFNRAPEMALVNFPVGEEKNVVVNGVKVKLAGLHLATKGREARARYKEIRGALPM